MCIAKGTIISALLRGMSKAIAGHPLASSVPTRAPWPRKSQTTTGLPLRMTLRLGFVLPF